MTHALARRRLTACDEGGNRLILHVRLNPLRSVLFRRAADFADHQNGQRFGIILEELQSVDEVRALDGVTANADRRRLTDARIRELESSLIRQGTGARDDADMTGLADRSRRDAELRLLGRQKTRAVRADETRLPAFHVTAHLHHVEDRDMLRDADDEIEIGINRFHDAVRRKTRGNINDRSRRARSLHSIRNRIEHGNALDLLTRLARRYACDNLRAIVEHLLRVERRRFARDALHDDLCIFINQN